MVVMKEMGSKIHIIVIVNKKKPSATPYGGEASDGLSSSKTARNGGW